MKDASLFRTGFLCTCATMLCCLTPILVVALGAVGLSAVVGWLDYVLLPAMAISFGITLFAGLRLMRRKYHARAALDRDVP